ncbi:MAG: IclR family transcriptional regulator [Gaiellaceae bacterium]
MFHIVDSMPTQTGTQSIERAAQLLVRVVESARPLAVGELAEAACLPKSTTSRLVGALERQGLVQRVGERGRVRPGPILLRFAQRDLPEANLVELSGPALRRLAEESGETINLGVPTPLGVEHLAQQDSRHFVGGTNWVGRRVPHQSTANGKIFLAYGAAPAPAGTDARALEAIRTRGYATAVDELEHGLSALAAPVFGPGGEVVAALSISGPTIRLTPERVEGLAPLLLEQCRALSARLGHPDIERGAA